jgi:4-amino-4-deoxy-L-arabinose transferase-like glycosyltransferase
MGLLALVGIAYFIRAGALPARGEEPRRAQIAREMVDRGDPVVPREQGEPFRVRPPLQNWLIAASCLACGSWGAWPVRLPSLLATVLTTLLIYGYSRTFLSRLGALSAAVAFATFADMFQMGRQAETEALFTLLVSGSLLTWHWGLMRRWPDALTYASGYSLMALAMLTKGLQAPVYFLGSLGAYLVLTGQWRRLFCKAHLLGALTGALILLAWMIPYAHALGWSEVHSIWLGDPAVQVNGQIQSWDARRLAVHLLTYPVEILLGTLPWSLLLLPYVRRDFRQSIGTGRPQVLFVSLALAIAFPTCWIPPGGLPRYFAPLFPCLAVLIGQTIERCADGEALAALRAAWRFYLGLVASLMLAAGVTAIVLMGPVGGYLGLPALAQPPLPTLGYALASIGLAVLIIQARTRAEPGQERVAVLALASFMVMTFTGVLTDVRLRRSEDAAAATRRIKQHLPPGQQLVSFGGHVDPKFAYHYGRPFITPRPWPTAGEGADLTYFCFDWRGNTRPHLPFGWTEVGCISLDRDHHAEPRQVVVVGRINPKSIRKPSS